MLPWFPDAPLPSTIDGRRGVAGAGSGRRGVPCVFGGCHRGMGFGSVCGGMPDKKRVIEKVVERLGEDVALYLRAARTAAAEATDEQSKAENKYDTRGLEASYLARGQSRQAAEVERALAIFSGWLARLPGSTDVVGEGSLVCMGEGRGKAWYLVAPCAGGTEVACEGEEVTVITPSSPLGRTLCGRKAGDTVQSPSGAASRVREVA